MSRSCLAWAFLVAGLAWGATEAAAQDHRFQFDESLIPRFNIPRMAKPPTVDGMINAAEWREAAKVMGVEAGRGRQPADLHLRAAPGLKRPPPRDGHRPGRAPAAVRGSHPRGGNVSRGSEKDAVTPL